MTFPADEIFGSGTNLSVLQMSSRGIVIFLLALIMIRVSGRRSFGLRTPLDNIISILLGAVLSRAVVGASPFLPVMVTCFIVVGLHRGLAWFIAQNPAFSRLIEGNKILIYQDGKFLEDNMKRVQICREDVMQGIRRQVVTEDLDQIDYVYIERNGEISAIKKK
ncbi:MAG TPA: YetF domain-containing protein [Mucilaginibacter sp.]|jgi:Predicted membrane protein